MRALVAVRLKDDISDAAGRTLQSKLIDLGYTEIQEARIGKLLEFEINSSDPESIKKRIDEMGRKLLANSETEELHLISIS